jgi:cellobiose-specific phosphotransferase system component IIB
MGLLSENTEQTIWNTLTNNSFLSEQEAANTYLSNEPKTDLSLQEAMSIRIFGKPNDMSVQEMLWYILKNDLTLTGPYTQYSEQELLNMAQDASIPITQILYRVWRYPSLFSKSTVADAVSVTRS